MTNKELPARPAGCPIWKHCNNPLNIRYNPANKWAGQIGEHNGFCVFKSMSYGIRAAFRLLSNYIKNGHDTLEEIVHRWAPACENDCDKYLKFVCEDTLIGKKEHLGNETEHDYWTQIMIIRAMATFESGRRFDEQQINLYINYPEKYV